MRCLHSLRIPHKFVPFPSHKVDHPLQFMGTNTKQDDSVNIVTQTVLCTPEVDLDPSSSYFQVLRPEASVTRPDRRPTLEYQTSDFELQDFTDAPARLLELMLLADQPDAKAKNLPMMRFGDPKGTSRVMIACLWAFCQGFSDGAPGALLPYMEEYYNINYSVVSMIWICNAIGVILLATMAHKLLHRLGIRYSLDFACALAIIMHSIVCTGTKFPVICFAFFLGGLGVSIAGSQLNIFVSRYEKASLALGYFHGCYGLGASVSPLVATAFVSHNYSWHSFYFVLLGLMAFVLVNVHFFFAGADELMVSAEEKGAALAENMLYEALRSKITWLMSVFVLFYQGAEVSVGAWIVTYIRDYRGNYSTSVGYVASGYWFGLTLGRLVMTPTTHHFLGPRVGNTLFLGLTVVFLSLVWAFKTTVAESVCVSLAGITIGPVYPLMITVASRVIPRKIQVVTLVLASAFGSTGGALFPFIIGLISQFSGAFVMLPACIAMFSCTLAIWWCLPRVPGEIGLRAKIMILWRHWFGTKENVMESQD